MLLRQRREEAANLEWEMTGGEVWSFGDSVDALLDTLRDHHAARPVEGVVPVLERIAELDDYALLSTRALLRLAAWRVPGSRERLAESVDDDCIFYSWRFYSWSRAELDELPEELRAKLAARE